MSAEQIFIKAVARDMSIIAAVSFVAGVLASVLVQAVVL